MAADGALEYGDEPDAAALRFADFNLPMMVSGVLNYEG